MVLSPRSPRLYHLLSTGRLYRHGKNETIFSTANDDRVMLVVKGYVKRYLISDTGSQGIQIIYGPQDIFSLTNIYNLLFGQKIYDGPETFYYKTMCHTVLYYLDSGVFVDAVQKDPLLYAELFSEAGHHLKACVHSIENIALPNTYARVAHELLFFAKKFGSPSAEGAKLALPLTHQDIADGLGISRETATKAIVLLRKQGLIGEGSGFRILDLKGLEAAAYHSQA